MVIFFEECGEKQSFLCILRDLGIKKEKTFSLNFNKEKVFL